VTTPRNPSPAQHRFHRWCPHRDQRGRFRRTRCLSREARGCSGQPASDNISTITYPQGSCLASTRPGSCCSHCRRAPLAVQFIGAASAAPVKIGAAFPGKDEQLQSETIASLRECLGDEQLSSTWMSCEQLDMASALNLADRFAQVLAQDGEDSCSN